MRILQVHNKYLLMGGEDIVVENERRLLSENAHSVDSYVISNIEIEGWKKKASVVSNISYSKQARDALSAHLSEKKPDIVHIHNTFPLLTPSVYDACIDHGVPIVQTLHNYRLGCASGLLLRNGKICEKCWHGTAYWGAVHACYRGSYVASLAASAAISHHRARNTWNEKVSCFIAPSEFGKEKYKELGFEAEKIIVKPHFVESATQQESDTITRHGALYVGRLSPEKGIRVLVESWRTIPYPLTIVGDGPLFDEISAISLDQVRVIGQKDSATVRRMMREAAFLIFPSICYEMFGLTIIEAFSEGLPVLAAANGGAKELLSTGEGGRLFAPNSADALRDAVIEFIADQPGRAGIEKSSRILYEQKYSRDSNYRQLLSLYESVIKSKRGK